MVTFENHQLVTDRDVKGAKRETIRFLENEASSWPKTAKIADSVKKYISERVDEIVYDECQQIFDRMRLSEEYEDYLTEISRAPKKCGHFDKRREILKFAAPLEQMVVLSDYISVHKDAWHAGRRTLCFWNGEDHVLPVVVMSSTVSKASTMKTILGSSRGRYKAPTYDELSKGKDGSFFSNPLEALEILRQPYFSGATVLKGDAFQASVITQRRRYEVFDKATGKFSQFACVELPHQNKKGAVQVVKAESVACNMFSLVKKHRKERIALSLRYEDVDPDGYNDDFEYKITPRILWKALVDDIMEQKSKDLVGIIKAMVLTRFFPLSSPDVNHWYLDQVVKNFE